MIELLIGLAIGAGASWAVYRYRLASVVADLDDVRAKYKRLTDRDERGRFKK